MASQDWDAEERLTGLRALPTEARGRMLNNPSAVRAFASSPMSIAKAINDEGYPVQVTGLNLDMNDPCFDRMRGTIQVLGVDIVLRRQVNKTSEFSSF